MAPERKNNKAKLMLSNRSLSSKTHMEKKDHKHLKDPYALEEDVMSYDSFQSNSKKSKIDPELADNLMSTSDQENLKIKTNLNTETGNDMFTQVQSEIKKLKEGPFELDEMKKKFITLINDQNRTRKDFNSNLFTTLSEIQTEIEEDYSTILNNNIQLEKLSKAYMKHFQQTADAFKNKLRMFNKMSTLKNQVEGLLARGGMKPDDRPIWYDVYRAFPPLVEPKFARPKPDTTPVRQIFYKEDVIRAEFHSKGHGLGAISMINQSNDTQIKRLVQQYQKLQPEGTPQEELIEKSVTAVGVERKEQYEATAAAKPKIPENPNSVTAQVMAEADLKNIFKE